MKKIFFSLLAIAALASCAKTEAVYTTDNSEIQIAPVTAMATKANVNGVIDGTTYPTKENFNVYAYWANQPAGSSFTADETGPGAYLNNVTFTNKGQFWGGVQTQYWPKNGSLRFAAYSPASLNEEATIAHYLAADVYEINGLTYPVNTAETYDILVTPTSKSYTAQTAAEKVSVVFEHALSWITFKLQSTDVADYAFTVKDVIVNGVNNHGNLVADMKAGTKTWSTAKPQKVNVFAGEQYVVKTAVDFENNPQGLLVLPQATTTVTINFTQNAIGDAPALENQSVTLPLTLDSDQPWEAGKHYTYTVIFDLDEILINPSVEDWEEIIVPAIDATATEVSTSEELVEAVAAGRSVRLVENIEVTETIVVDPSAYATKAGEVNVVLDLNGKTIKNADPVKDVIIVKEGATLTINGDGTVEAISGGDGYTVISEGTLIINGGTFKSGVDADKAPNAVIYARENGKVFVNGGTFPNDMTSKFVLNKKDAHRATTTIEVTGGVFYNFNPGNNAAENVPTNFLAAGYASYELQPNVWTVLKNDVQIEVASNAALKDVATWGGNAVLTSDLTLSAAELNVAEGRTVTLDLNGKTLTVASLDPIKNFGTMTLLNGKIEAKNSENTRRCVYNYGTMTIDGVEFVQTYSKKGAAINNEGKLTIEDATVDAVYYSIWTSGANAKTVVNGGTYTTTNDVTLRDIWAYAVTVRDDAELTVNDGTFVGNHGAIAAEGGSAVLNDGVYECTATYTGNSDWSLYAADGGQITYNAVTCTVKTANPNGAIYGNVTAM